MKIKFSFKSPILIEEININQAIIRGVLLSEGVSRNGNLYTINEMEKIAVQCANLPIQFGITEEGRHKEGKTIGRIIRAWLDKTARKIRFIGEVYGDFAHKVKANWGLSIEGIVKEAKYVKSKLGKIILHIKNVIMRKIQLVEPSTKRGVSSAKVESVEVRESMSFDREPSRRTLAVLSALISEGLI